MMSLKLNYFLDNLFTPLGIFSPVWKILEYVSEKLFLRIVLNSIQSSVEHHSYVCHAWVKIIIHHYIPCPH